MRNSRDMRYMVKTCSVSNMVITNSYMLSVMSVWFLLLIGKAVLAGQQDQCDLRYGDYLITRKELFLFNN